MFDEHKISNKTTHPTTLILIFKIDNRLSQIKDFQKEPPSQNNINQAYAIAEEESETYTCAPESPIYPLLETLLYHNTPHLQKSSRKPNQSFDVTSQTFHLP